MNVFTPLSILILSMLIIASMQLIPNLFAYFYHYASGKYSSKKLGALSIFYILGAEALAVIIFIILNFLIYVFSFMNFDFTEGVFLWAAIGLLFSLGIAFFCFYYRKGKEATLFISRNLALNLRNRASSVKNKSDAFILGFVSGIPELIFTLPLYLLVLIAITKNFLLTAPCSFVLASFILIIISPLFFIYAYFKLGNNFADYLKIHKKNKTFFRYFIPSLYFILATLIIVFKVIL